jgi:hypothetical protein
MERGKQAVKLRGAAESALAPMNDTKLKQMPIPIL